MGLRLAFKEWAGVIEALAEGHQIFLLRKYEPDEAKFCLYPTYSYYTSIQNYPERLNDKVKPEFAEKAKNAALEQLKEKDIVKLKYFFEVDEVIHLADVKRVVDLEPCMIWSVSHVSQYAETAKKGMFVWIGRTKELSKTVVAARQTGGGSLFKYNHFEDIDTTNSSQMLEESVFQKRRTDLFECLSLNNGS